MRASRPARHGFVLARLAATLAVLAVAACGPGSGDAATPDPSADGFPSEGRVAADQLSTLVVGYEMVAGPDQRVLIGLLSGTGSDVVSFGDVDAAFFFRGTQQQPLAQRQPGPTARAHFLPVPGSPGGEAGRGPSVVAPSEGLGVYGTEPVRFDRSGFWEVEVSATIDGKAQTAPAAPFLVLERSFVPAPGDPAPMTVNALSPGPGVPASSIDSRALGGASVPDPILHSITVADAIALGRPTLVVVSTPTYCVSRFCGPITEGVEALAARHGGAMSFVHLEVWRDFEAKEVNPSAAEWIAPEGVEEVSEPWVFLVGRDGVIIDRWDNVATDAELAAAVARVLG